jgi:AraC family transcriptional regulator
MASRTREILRLLAVVNGRRHEDVSLRALSGLAHRSPFDLHRRFRRVVGETPKAYTTRVRLARAAAELLATDRLTSVIAARNGFASHEVFTRAFTRLFGLSPRAYRARRLHTTDDRSAAIHAALVDSVAPCVGLYRLTTVERNAPMTLDIAVKDLPVAYALVMRRRITREDIATALSECLPAVFTYALGNGLALAGPPFARYPELGMAHLVLEAGITVAALPSTEPGGGIETLTLPARRAAVAIHRGPYDRLPETYRAIEEWLDREGLTSDGAPMETYLTDPGEHPDPATWETEVAQPIR